MAMFVPTSVSIDSTKVVLPRIREIWRILRIWWGLPVHGTRRVEVVGPCDTLDIQEEVNLHGDTVPQYAERDCVDCEDFRVSSRGMVEGLDLEDRQPKHNRLSVEDRGSIQVEAGVDSEHPSGRHTRHGPSSKAGTEVCERKWLAALQLYHLLECHELSFSWRLPRVNLGCEVLLGLFLSWE